MFSKTKRFNEKVSCAPPVGHYVLPDNQSVKLAGFEKANRWTEKPEDTSKGRCDVTAESTNSSMNKTFNPTLYSSVKKMKQPKTSKQDRSNVDVVRKSLEVDVEFQQSKVHALLEKIQSLEIQLRGTQDHSLEIEKSNEKLHELLGDIRNEKSLFISQNLQLEDHIKTLEEEKLELGENMENQCQASSRQLEELTIEYNNEKEELMKKLKFSEKINVDFREQLEGVETVMTNNLRGLSEKYENLEETLDNVQSSYKSKLQRSNSLVEKIKEANEISKQDLQVMQEVYNNLKADYENSQNEMIEKDTKYQEKETALLEKIKTLQEQVNEITKTLELTNNMLQKEKNINTKLSEGYETTKYHLIRDEEDMQEKANECFRLGTVISELNGTLENLRNDNVALMKNLESTQMDLKEISDQKEIEQEKYRFKTEKIQSMKMALSEENEALKSESARSSALIEEQQTSFDKIKDTFQERIHNLHEQLKSSQEQYLLLEEKKVGVIDEIQVKELQEDLERWRSKYSELETKVGPFMSQLEQFELEKQALLCENDFKQHEMNRLSERYAQILGHQNNKQKIHHIRKLKEENLSLKNDVMKLRTEVTKLKRNQVEKRGKKFDHTKAFHKEGKENHVTKAPLKPCNS